MADGPLQPENPEPAPPPPTVESVFQRRIEFHPARKHYSQISTGGDFYLETLNPGAAVQRLPTASVAGAPPMKRSEGGEFHEHGLDPELSFRITFRRIGAGLANLGNTCFLNSVLQCLTYTEPFAAYLQSGKHKSSCHTAGFCAMCALQNHVMNALQSTGKILSPSHLVKNLRCISRNFRNSRQEDAHEYMVNLLESMHKCCLPSGVPSESPNAYENSLVHKIFGGRLRSQVKCMQCSYCSNKFDPFLDLSLEIVKADSLRKALSHYTAVEQLDGGEKQYQCQRCKQKVRALKQLTIHKAPYVLTIHLKRFSSIVPGQKIDKKVEFAPTLDLKPFVSDLHEGGLKYTLYGVLVHAGWSTHSGHYYCFVRTSSGMWHSLDDNQVRQVSEKTVFEQKAYMLFYVRDRDSVKKPVDVYKEYVPANPSASGVKGTSKNIVVDRKLNTSEHTSVISISNASSRDRSRSLVNYSTQYPLQKTYSSQNNVNGTLKGASVVQSNSPAVLKEASNFHFKVNILALESQQKVVAEDYLKVTSDELLLKRPLTTSTVQMAMQDSSHSAKSKDSNAVSTSHTDVASITPNGAAANGRQQNVSSTCNMVSDDVAAKPVLVNTCGKSGGMNGCCQREAFDTKLVDYENKEEYSHNAHCQKGGEKMVKLKEAGVIDTYEKTSATTVEEGCAIGTGKERSANCYQQAKVKHKKQTKLARVKTLHFSHKKLFLRSLSVHKSKKHKCRKRVKPRNLLKGKENMMTNDHEVSTSEPATTVGVNSMCPSKHSCSGSDKESSIRKRKNVKMGNNDSVNANTEGTAEKNGNNCYMPSTSEQSKSCTSSVVNQNDSKETNTYVKGPEKDGFLNLLTRGLKENSVPRWDDMELPHSQTFGPEDRNINNIGYVLDEWDEEYDWGKRKKVKKSKHLFGGPNVFQEAANKMTQHKMKVKQVNRTSSGNEPFRI